jgi:hypothetical protein
MLAPKGSPRSWHKSKLDGFIALDQGSERFDQLFFHKTGLNKRLLGAVGNGFRKSYRQPIARTTRQTANLEA